MSEKKSNVQSHTGLTHTYIGEVARVWREMSLESHMWGFDGDSHWDGSQQRRSGSSSEELRKLLPAHRKTTHAARCRQDENHQYNSHYDDITT